MSTDSPGSHPSMINGPRATLGEFTLYADRVDTPDGSFALGDLYIYGGQKAIVTTRERTTATRVVAGTALAGPVGGAVAGKALKKQETKKQRVGKPYIALARRGEGVLAQIPQKLHTVGLFGRHRRRFQRALAEAQQARR